MNVDTISRACSSCRAPFMPSDTRQTRCRRCGRLPARAVMLCTVGEAIGPDRVAQLLEAVAR